VANADGIVYGLSARSGRRFWRTDLDAPVIASPVIAGKVVYLGDRTGRLHALDVETGRVLWHATVSGEIFASPAVVRGAAFVGTAAGQFCAIGPASLAEPGDA
jgi:outer membrane protein assembly factor BamB